MVYTAENVSKVVFYEYNLPLLRQSGIVNFISVLLNDQECQPVTFCCVDLFYLPRSGMVMRRCNLVVVDAFSFKFFQGEEGRSSGRRRLLSLWFLNLGNFGIRAIFSIIINIFMMFSFLKIVRRKKNQSIKSIR